jgi:membrane protease YdiL (CAAX protease family)
VSASRPISSARAVQLLFGLARRRFFNRWSAAYSRKSKDPHVARPSYREMTELIGPAERKRRELAGIAVPPEPAQPDSAPKRIGTAPKSGGMGCLALFLSAGLFFNGFNIASNLLSQLANSIPKAGESKAFSEVSSYTLGELKKADEAYAEIRAHPDAPWHDSYKKQWDDHLDQVFAYEFNLESFPESEKEQRIARLWQFYHENGSAAFFSSGRANPFMSSEDWPAADRQTGFIRALALLLGLFSLATVAMTLGLNNKDLGQVDWAFKWLYTLPVSARALYFAQLINGAVFNPQVWMFLVPFLIKAFLTSTWSWGSLFAALAVSAYYMVICGALALLIEVSARKYLSLSRLKSLQALLTVFGMAFLLAYLACAFSRPVAQFYGALAGFLPAPVLLQPFSLPAFLLDRDAAAGRLDLIWGGMALWAFLAVGSVVACEWLTREGLMRAGGPFQGARKKAAVSARRPWLSGVPAKEMRLLLRDHNFMVQVLVVPLIGIAYYLLVNSSILAAARGNFHHAATLAFCVGAYGLTTSAMQILNHEKATLWQLYTFPRSIISVMAEKTLVWAGFAFLYAAITLAIFGYFSRQLHYSAWIDCLISLYGVVLYAFIAGGIGILATNVLDPTPRGRVRADMVYLNLFLIGMYAYAIYSPSFWDKLAQLVLSTLLAYALWQKAKDRLPYLLDPEISPPPEVSLADGLIAALAFFVLQGFLVIIFAQGQLEATGRQITLAYGIAGLTVTVLMIIALTSRKIPELADYLGFTTKKFRSGFERTTKSIALGLFGGGVAALGAAVYLHVLALVPGWEAWKDKSVDESLLFSPDNYLWMLLLLVVAAPLCEEFIFRGLVFRGLRRSLPPTLAIVASAALFALVHPPVSVIPVFGLGLATAIVFERTKFLLAPITAHAIYNACVILLNHQ